MLKQVLTGSANAIAGSIIPLGSLAGFFTSTITVSSNSFVIPTGGSGFYLMGVHGFTNSPSLTTVEIRKNGTAFYALSSGVGDSWSGCSTTAELAAGDTISFYTIGGAFGINNGGHAYIFELFATTTSAYTSPNACFLETTVDTTIAAPTNYPISAAVNNVKTTYGTTANITNTAQNPICVHGSESDCILSMSYASTGLNNRGIQATMTTYGGRNTGFCTFASTGTREVSEVTMFFSQANGLSQALTFFSAPTSGSTYNRSSLGFIKV